MGSIKSRHLIQLTHTSTAHRPARPKRRTPKDLDIATFTLAFPLGVIGRTGLMLSQNHQSANPQAREIRRQVRLALAAPTIDHSTGRQVASVSNPHPPA